MTEKGNMRAPLEHEDAELARQSQAGNRDAFGEVVARYQSLICSLAYSATGNIGRSEELAQETFLTAWKQLGSLREPQRLRSWLCGIARNLINNSFRREGRQPLDAAEPLEKAKEASGTEPLPSEQAISREEETLVWRALEQVPELYREPLVLFYREEKSVEAVAAQLELSQEAVRQRLARGRELLRAEVASLVEGVLRRSRPGRVFTLAVLAALPGLAVGSAKAAAFGAAGKTAAPAAKALLAAGSLGGLLGGLGGLAGAAFGGWASWQTARYQSVRDLVKRSLIFYGVVTLVFLLGIFAIEAFGRYFIRAHPVAYGVTLAAWIVGDLTLTMAWSLWLIREHRRILAREIAAGTSPLPQTPVVRRLGQWSSKWEGRQWQSPWTFLGLPLVHINFSSPRADSLFAKATVSALMPPERGTARGWIAIGDRALGILFACGGQAYGGIAIGGLSVGLLSIGGLAIGAVSIGGGAVGVLAFGGGAIGLAACGGGALGWFAAGGGAIAWHAALGGMAYAHDFAVGGLAIALHANDAVARAFMSDNLFIRASTWFMTHGCRSRWFLPLVLSFSFLPSALMLLVGYRRARKT
jgi:RNA polymerase sigma factor (sigma-70 family)